MAMLAPCLFLLCLADITPSKPALITAAVHVDGRGPYKFLVDTGAESTLIHDALAAELRIAPRFRVELVTVNGAQMVPGTRLTGVRIGSATLPELEVLFHELTEARRLDPDIRGVIGANALAHLSFQLIPSAGQIDTASTRPGTGHVIPFSLVDGRIAVEARMGRESLKLVLDSGASHVVLFRTPEAMAKTHAVQSAVSTMDGARNVVPTVWTADMVFEDRLRIGMLPAAIVKRQGDGPVGLLPASVFKKIFVDRVRSELVVER